MIQPNHPYIHPSTNSTPAAPDDDEEEEEEKGGEEEEEERGALAISLTGRIGCQWWIVKGTGH